MLTIPTWAFIALAVACFTLPFWLALYSIHQADRRTVKRNNYFDPRKR
jgi:type VI protein secretion system component VasF